jgi:folylpolyglutamate synthase/dihydropteroate synthase
MEDIARAFASHAPVVAVPAVKDAITQTIDAARPEDVVVVTGSIYTVGEALELLGGWE